VVAVSLGLSAVRERIRQLAMHTIFS
jgi:hypothetical protein